jgi:hypothetical protein
LVIFVYLATMAAMGCFGYEECHERSLSAVIHIKALLRALKVSPRNIAQDQYGQQPDVLSLAEHLPSGTRVLFRCLSEARTPHPGLARP